VAMRWRREMGMMVVLPLVGQRRLARRGPIHFGVDGYKRRPVTRFPQGAMMHPTRRRAFAILLGLGIPLSAGAGEHIGAAEVRAMVAAAPGRADLSGRDLSGDDLTGLDLSGARLIGTDLSGANLHGVKLVGANLAGANLSRADLTFAWFIRARFDNANLSGATLQTVVTSTGMENTREQAASFVGANLSDAKITVHFSFDDMRGANFSHADMTVVMANQSMGLLRTEFIAANLDGANFSGAGLGHVTFRFAKLRGANFRGADLSDADFTGAYLNDADFTGANTSRTNFESATMSGVKGLDQTR
jgi:uncharacterized protein YjbI with pentapeptide repeats